MNAVRRAQWLIKPTKVGVGLPRAGVVLLLEPYVKPSSPNSGLHTPELSGSGHVQIRKVLKPRCAGHV